MNELDDHLDVKGYNFESEFNFEEFVKQYLHLKLQALLKFRSIPLVLVPTLPSFFIIILL